MSNSFSLYTEPIYLVYPSDDVLHSNPDSVSASSQTFVRMKETLICVSGSIRISFDLRTAQPGTAYGKIYINDIPAGTERSQPDNGFNTYTEDLPVKYGDLVQIYGKHSTAASFVIIQNLILKGILYKTFQSIQ